MARDDGERAAAVASPSHGEQKQKQEEEADSVNEQMAVKQSATAAVAVAAKSKRAKLDLEKMEAFKKRAEKRGVVYISRVPPFMKPEKVKHLLGQYGDINRIYLVPEDKTSHKKRVAAGGNRKPSFTEGWIEFEDKKVAKQVAKVLNTRQIGGRKRDYYHDDIWNLKYLKGFKWDHLTEKIAYENRIRDQKLRMEIAQAKKENDAYLEKVEQSKKFDKMEARKHGSASGSGSGTRDASRDAQHQQMRRSFVQKAPASSKTQSSLHDDALLEKVFAKKRKLAA